MKYIVTALEDKRRLLIAVASVAVVLFAFQNCSEVKFSEDKGKTDPAQAATGGDGTGSPPDLSTGGIPQNGGTTGGPPVTGGPGGTTNPVNVPPGYPPPPPGSTDAPPTSPPGATYPPGTSIPPGTITPKVVRGEPPCQRGTWCEYNLTLDKTYAMVVDFDWRTNDDQSRAVSVPAGFIRAQPNTHYVPGSGHVRFLPGETTRKIYVLNINPDPVIQIVIPFIFSSCKYGMIGTSCVAMFN
jgi:hypothetical protein